MNHEFLVTHIPTVARFVDDKIGVEHDASYSDNDPLRKAGSLTVFDLLESERQDIRSFITKEKLWSE